MDDKVKSAILVITAFGVINTIHGLLLLGFGIYFTQKYFALLDRLHYYFDFIADNILILDLTVDGDEKFYWTLLLAGGSALLLVAQVVWALRKKNARKLKSLVICCVLLCFVKLIAAVIFWAYSFSTNPLNMLWNMQTNFKCYMENDNCKSIQVFMEVEHECCGVLDRLDYHQFHNMTQYPASCYETSSSTSEKLNLHGCHEIVHDHLISKNYNLALILLITGLWEGLGAIPAFYLFRKLKEEEEPNPAPV